MDEKPHPPGVVRGCLLAVALGALLWLIAVASIACAVAGCLR